MAVSVRTRFEVFKRDNFTCRYCGRKSPEVVLELDHILATANGGGDDEMNLLTSCWECNRGKSAVPLSQVITGEDPHDAAVVLLEKRRQLEEYNAVLKEEHARRFEDWKILVNLWPIWLSDSDEAWLMATLKYVPREVIYQAMEYAIFKNKTRNLAYVNVMVKRWKEEIADV